MPLKDRKELSKSLRLLSKSKLKIIDNDRDLTKSVLEHKANTFTPYKIHLISLGKKIADVEKIGNLTRSSVL